MPSTVQQLILVVWGSLLTSAFGVFSVWMNIVLIAPAKAYGLGPSFESNDSTRGLTRVFEAVHGVDVVC